MDGFGINDTWADSFTSVTADALFTNTGGGIGLSILRVGLGADGKPMSTNITPDIAMARARGVTTIIGTLWSAPNSCKNEGRTGGGHLLASCYESWATTVAAFAEDNGLTAMSIQNEPDYCGNGATGACSDNYPTMLYTADELVAFLKVVGPKLHALSPPVKVIAPETSEWLHLWPNNSATGSKDPLGGKCDYGHALYKDAEAWGLIDIVGTHQYETQVAEPWPNDVPDTKTVWMTEMSGIRGWPEQGPSTDIKNGVAVAGWIHDAIVNGMASAWLWWWYQAQGSTNEGLYNSDGSDTKRHYTFGNYTKFVRPGYKRVDVTGAIPADVLFTAYTGTDTVVVVAINKGSAAASVPITIAGGTAPASCTPTVTSASDNLKAGTTVPVRGGTFTASLASLTVTTFVCK
jgi:glucuronoarabinoxylan endo-1,4-beta-xylanase